MRNINNYAHLVGRAVQLTVNDKLNWLNQSTVNINIKKQSTDYLWDYVRCIRHSMFVLSSSHFSVLLRKSVLINKTLRKSKLEWTYGISTISLITFWSWISRRTFVTRNKYFAEEILQEMFQYFTNLEVLAVPLNLEGQCHLNRVFE